MSAGTETTGAVVSRTVTLNEAVAVLPAASAAERPTAVVVIAKVVPVNAIGPAAVLATTATVPSVSSTAVAVKFTTAPAALVASRVRLPGPVMTGGVVSLGSG